MTSKSFDNVKKLNDLSRSISEFGAVGDGVTDDTAAIQAAAASGVDVIFKANATYLMSAGALVASNTSLRCPGGVANIKFKTGVGGFNITSISGTRTDTDRCAFPVIACDNVVFEGLNFYPDGLNARVIYPIRVAGGMAVSGVKFRRLTFTAFHVGVMIAVASVGAGAYDFDRLYAYDCGTSLTTWTGGTPQWTLFETDNDMVAGVHSEPGRGTMIGCKNCLFTGAALAAYGQQTDCINIAGISGATDRKGPVINGVFVDGVGEGIDIFGRGCVITGARLRNCHNFAIKFIHGATDNNVTADLIENAGLAGVTFSGSDATSAHCSNNNVHVGVLRNVGQGLSYSSGYGVVFIGGTLAVTKNNTVTFDNVIETNGRMATVVQDGTADTNNNNFVQVLKASGYTLFSSAPPGNVRIRVKDSTRVQMRLGSIQTLTTGVSTKVLFNTVFVDANGEADTVNSRVRCKTPGIKLVRATLRMNSLNADDDVEVTVKVGSQFVKTEAKEVSSGTLETTMSAQSMVYIDENAAGTSAADVEIYCTVVSGAGTIQILTTTTMTQFEVVDVGG
jgi:hypothetical protein